jgi:F-type H+-transporting ATPase subunit delta
MSLAAAAERYARAIFELGLETGQLDQLTAGVADFAASYVDVPSLKRVLDSPVVEQSRREQVLREVGRRSALSPLCVNALLVMLRRRRLPALAAVARRLRTLADEKNGICRATIISASSLPETYLTQLEQQLERTLGKRVVVEHQEDPSLIGGVVTRIGDNTFDGSLAGRLEELERTLLSTQ